MPMGEPTSHSPWTENAIRAQLERILGHPEFHATDKMRSFLRFVVEETLAGNGRQLKGFTIATEVFGRDQDFDPAHDPVVRIQAGRLRRAIERYYLVAGKADPIRIEIPKGSYVPEFSEGPAAGAGSMATSDALMQPMSGTWPSVLVLPFEDMTGSPELAYLGPGLATELWLALGACSDLRIMLSPDQIPGTSTEEPSPDFVIRGSVRRQGSKVKLVVQLVAAASGEQVWIDALMVSLADGGLIAFQENTAASIAAQIASEHGAIFRTVSRISTPALTAQPTSYQAMLKGYAYHQKVDLASWTAAREALEQVHSADGSCGPVCTMLAILYLDNLAMEFVDVRETPQAEAMRLAQEGAMLEPGNQMSRLVLARAHVLDGDLDAGRAEARAALALNPNSLLFLDAIGYVMVLLGEWDQGEALLRKAIRLNPFYRVFCRYAIWLNAFRRGDYEQALDEMRGLAGVGSFWDPLGRAATLGQLGRGAEGRAAIRELVEIVPDFSQRGPELIRRFVKFPEIRQRMIEGLAVAGLRLVTATD